ncbi:DUF533 domain-containing protein [Hasllibacter sp. MH4015]|uniref:DUF533 domain-containing protein n=1 Tax=Hasllibacter sp. MH4015 TaxID=2854029 RepID=UPI001CD4F149|nr:DUF533 domain-containing protein [Hasllibacter sp. MH4015]
MSFLKTLGRMARGMAERQADRAVHGDRRRSLSIDLFSGERTETEHTEGGILNSLRSHQADRDGDGRLSMAERRAARDAPRGIGDMIADLGEEARNSGGLRAFLTDKIEDAKDAFDGIMGEAEAKIVLRAMILAAKADGHIDADERAAIMDHMGEDATEDDRAFLTAEIEEGPDLDTFLESVPPNPELRRQIFAMSLLAIDVDTPEEEAHIRKLAQGLELSATDVEMARSQIDGA